MLQPGLLALIEDFGRPGYAELGVGRSGAADPPSLRLGNLLVGNQEGAAGIELTFGGAAFRCLAPATIAVTGAPAPVTVAGHPAPLQAPLQAGRGDVVRIGRPTAGLRTYLTVRGGIDLPPVLGSRSRDTLAGLGPEPLRRGDLLPIGAAPHTGGSGLPIADPVELPAEMVLRVHPGPRLEWFTGSALPTLLSTAYQVTPRTDRVGMRLSGPPLRHLRAAELPPEGMVLGALQVPPDGQPLLFLADHPVTGGYPVIAVVTSRDVPLAAQARPGQWIRFTSAE